MKNLRLGIIILGLICATYGIYYNANRYVKIPDTAYLYNLLPPCVVFVAFFVQLIYFVKAKDKK